MTSSAQYTFSESCLQIISSAYRKIGAIAEDETPTAGMISDAVLAFNGLLKEWATSGIHIWTTQEAILFLQQDQARYLLGTGTSPNPATHCCDAFAYSVSQIISSAASGASTITLADTTGFVNGTNIGIVLDSGTTQWTTINGVPSGGVVTLAATLTGNASVNNFAFSYAQSATIQSPLRVPAARRIAWQGLIETPCTRLSRQEYMDYPNKVNPGVPTQFFYVPELLNGVPQGQFYVYLNPQDSQSGMRFTYLRPLQDITTTPGQTGDFPIEWTNTCVWNLAQELGPEYDVPPNRWTMIQQQAANKLEMARGWDREPEDISFGYSFDQTQR